MKTQLQLYRESERKLADRINAFAELVRNNDITAAELRALIARRPDHYSMFSSWIPVLEARETATQESR